MGRIITLSFGTVVIIALLFACFTCSALGLFLQTFFALTRETVIAEVIMSPIQSDARGQYIELQFTPYEHESAFMHIFNPDEDNAPQTEGTQTYRVYGDTVGIRGPFVKLHSGLLVLNFENVYKLALIEGEYRRPGTEGEGTEIEVNGGFSDFWWDFNDNEATYPYSLIVDRFTFAGAEEPGFTGNNRKRYEIVATADTLTWNFIEDVP